MDRAGMVDQRVHDGSVKPHDRGLKSSLEHLDDHRSLLPHLG